MEIANYLFEWEKIIDIKLSLVEKKNIKKYRSLDNFGKKVVDKVLDIEYERCQHTDEETVTVTIAARSKNNDEPIKVVEIPKKDLDILDSAPESDEKL